jgi:hypothetical protein
MYPKNVPPVSTCFVFFSDASHSHVSEAICTSDRSLISILTANSGSQHSCLTTTLLCFYFLLSQHVRRWCLRLLSLSSNDSDPNIEGMMKQFEVEIERLETANKGALAETRKKYDEPKLESDVLKASHPFTSNNTNPAAPTPAPAAGTTVKLSLALHHDHPHLSNPFHSDCFLPCPQSQDPPRPLCLPRVHGCGRRQILVRGDRRAAERRQHRYAAGDGGVECARCRTTGDGCGEN